MNRLLTSGHVTPGASMFFVTAISLSLAMLVSSTNSFAANFSNDTVARSEFIFKGKITGHPASPTVETTVAVETVIKGGESLRRLLGGSVRVDFSSPTIVLNAHEYIFASTPVQWGSDVVVSVVAFEPAQTEIVFDGVVQQVTHTASTGRGGGRRTTAIFRVDKAWSGQAPGAALSGKVIKVQVQGLPVAADEHLTIYSTDSPLNLNLVHAAITTPNQELALWNQVRVTDDEKGVGLLRSSISRALIVLEGTVTSVDINSASKDCNAILLDNPRLATARVHILRTYKGASTFSSEIDVAFVQSNDIRWSDAPKLTANQRLILFLRPASVIGCTGNQRLGVYTKDDVLDTSKARLVQEAISPR